MSQSAKSHHIEFDQIEVKYSDYVYGLRGVTLTIEQGEFVFFVGKTGTGKSTLLKLITKEVRPTSGVAKLWGVDVEQIPDKEIPLLRRTMGIVPQDYGLLPRKRVWENVAYAMRATGASRKEVRKRLPEILESVNVGHRADAFPHQLSGGEQQRVAIARALVNDPQLLIADEPTGNLDPEHSWEIMEVLLRLNRNGTTVLVASHDMLIVERMGMRVVTMQSGRIASDETPEPALFEDEATWEDVSLPVETDFEEPEPASSPDEDEEIPEVVVPPMDEEELAAESIAEAAEDHSEQVDEPEEEDKTDV